MKMSYCPNWRPFCALARKNMSLALVEWMSDPGSFMKRLQRAGVLAQITVTKHAWELPSLDERIRLALPLRAKALIREVSIHTGDTIWMTARTIFPASVLSGKEKQFALLKNKALGTLLFKNPRIIRSPYEIAHDGKGFWRRSVFHLPTGKTLLLTERMNAGAIACLSQK